MLTRHVSYKYQYFIERVGNREKSFTWQSKAVCCSADGDDVFFIRSVLAYQYLHDKMQIARGMSSSRRLKCKSRVHTCVMMTKVRYLRPSTLRHALFRRAAFAICAQSSFGSAVDFRVANASFHVIGERQVALTYRKNPYYHSALYLFLHCACLARVTYKAAFSNDDWSNGSWKAERVERWIVHMFPLSLWVELAFARATQVVIFPKLDFSNV